MLENSLVLGVDIGGSHITAALVDLATGTITPGSYKRSFVNGGDDAETILNSWAAVISEALNSKALPAKKIGVAMPGPFDYSQGISLIKEQEKFQSLYKINVKNELAKRLNIRAEEIRFINDAAGFLKGEVFAGAARHLRSVLGLTLGTGLGSALYVEGTAYDAALWDSPFLGGIAEDHLSTRWFINRYSELSGKTVAGVRELMTENNGFSELVFLEFGKNLGEFMIPFIKAHHSDMVILGGNISLAFGLFEAGLHSVLNADHISAVVKVSELNENAALIGAATCWEIPVMPHFNEIPNSLTL
jgi:glucokinase